MKEELTVDLLTPLRFFAEEHDLTLKIHVDIYGEFRVSFKNVEIKDGSILKSLNGYGASKQEAINDYARKISKQLLVVDAYQDTRKEISCGQLREAK